MSTSILYHAFGIRDVKYLATRYEQGEIIFEGEMKRKLARCPECRSRKVIYKGSRVRELRMAPIGARKTWLHLKVHKLLCKDCGSLRWPRLPFAPPRVNYTTAYERLVSSFSSSPPSWPRPVSWAAAGTCCSVQQ